MAGAILLVFSVLLIFSYDTSNINFSLEGINDNFETALGDSLSARTDDSSVFIEGKILADEGLTSSLLALEGVKMEHALEITNSLKYQVDFRFLSAGEEFIVEMDKNKEFVKSFSYIPNPVTTHKLVRNTDGSLEYELITLPTEKRYRHVKGEITTTLNQALFDCKIEPSVSATVYGILECVVNFRYEARKG
ncbi:MAG: hypothetical protein KKD38_01465, partial [Candidatus Delongbacteria bacterium]|nr:hypothetical protein [Candidatus Delongbacteria bacterium]MCG2760268.1 hypothetical protein [Candidatus Delongbacteria bacterium]